MKRLFFYIILGVVVLLLPGVPALAQTEQKVRGVKTLSFQGLDNDSILSAFSQRFVVLDSLMRRTAEPEDGLTFVGLLRTDVLDSVFDEKEAYERKAFKRKHGLELTGQAYYRLDDQLGFDEDDQYSRYKAKFQGELGWNLFNSSFLQRKSQLRLIGLTNEAERLQEQKKLFSPLSDRAEDYITRQYDVLSAAVLHEQLLNNEVLQMAYLFILENDRAGNDKLLEANTEKMRIEHALAQTGTTAADACGQIRIIRPVLVSVDSTRLLAHLRDYHVELRESQVREEALDARIRLTNYAHSMRLTPFVRVSHYLRSTLGSSTNVEVGARFTFPFYGDASAKRRALRTEQAITSLGRENLCETLTEQCRRLISQLDRLNVAIDAEQRHADLLRRFIALRTQAYLNSQNGYNHVARLEEYNEYLKSLERTYDLLRLRDLCLLDLQKAAGYPDMSPMIQTKEVSL